MCFLHKKRKWPRVILIILLVLACLLFIIHRSDAFLQGNAGVLFHSGTGLESLSMQLTHRNLLMDTQSMKGWKLDKNAAKPLTLYQDAEGFGIIQWLPSTEKVWVGALNNGSLLIPFSAVQGKTVTLSFEWRSSDWSKNDSMHIYYSLTQGKSRTLYNNRRVNLNPSSEWQQVSVTQTLSDSFFAKGSGAIDDNTKFYVKLGTNSLGTCEVRKIKLEVGNRPTPWTP